MPLTTSAELVGVTTTSPDPETPFPPIGDKPSIEVSFLIPHDQLAEVHAGLAAGRGELIFTPDASVLAELVGELHDDGPAPAAWWTSTDPAVTAAWDEYCTAYDAHQDRISTVMEALGVEAMFTNGVDGTIHGFQPTSGMLRPEGHPQHTPLPDGWRIDAKSRTLVPSRRTNAERDSEANRLLAELNADAVPYQPSLPGMPATLRVPGARHRTHLAGGAHCVLAFLSADPDQVQGFNVDTERWTRRTLSEFHLIREGRAASRNGGTA